MGLSYPVCRPWSYAQRTQTTRSVNGSIALLLADVAHPGLRYPWMLRPYRTLDQA